MSEAAPDLAAPWYRLADLDREDELVWLRAVAGRIVKGVVRFTRKGQSVAVLTPDGRGLERVKSYAKPDLWQPFDPLAWGPLPHPAVVQPEPPPLIRPRPAREHAPAARPPLPEAIPYNPPGAIARAECEARLLRALKTDRALPDTDRLKLAVRTNWPETGYAPGDWPPEISLRWRPFPEDVSDYLVAMAWFARLEPFDRRLVRLRALGRSFRAIGEELRWEKGAQSDEWARLRYAEAIDRALVIANRG